MPSITYWNRVEPRPRASGDIGPHLAARVHDPVWFLTRQWQFGEFHGEDAGSPAFVELATTTSPFVGWRAEGQATIPLSAGAPLERQVETEAFGRDLSLRVELGQTFEALLAEHVADTGDRARLVAAFRVAYPIDTATPAMPPPEADVDTVRFFGVCAGRALDGVALYDAVVRAQPALPSTPAIAAPDLPSVQAAVAAFLTWVPAVFPELTRPDPPTWRPTQLEYRVEVVATEPGGGTAVFGADPGRTGEFGWYAFDLRPSAPDGGLPAGPVATARASLLPMHVRFRGMPNHRWWDFESGTTDFGAIDPEKRDVAKLVVMDFMLVHGNDYFTIPLEQPVGTLCRVDALVVHDVFGGLTAVERADAAAGPPGERWTMFSTSVADDPTRLAAYFILPPSAGSALQAGQPLEEVRFLRDEMANIAWAIEALTENGIGEPWRGHERDIAVRVGPPATPVAGAGAPSGPPLRYQVQTLVPINWFPLVPVTIDPALGEIALELGAMVRAEGGSFEPLDPHGRLLRPAGITSYRMREEEVPKTGARVSRVVCRARWTDGSTHLWITRRKTPGAGEGSSGLRFDLAVPTASP